MTDPFVLPEGAVSRLRLADPALGRWIERIGPCTLVPGQDEGPLDALVRALLSQQISGKAAATIQRRFRLLFAADRFPEAARILALDPAQLRACGVSEQKAGYLRSLCERVASGALALDRLGEQDDEEIVGELTPVKGFGRWTAQMFLIFHLGRLDVWPCDDLGVRKGLARVHGVMPTPAQMGPLGERYRPYRSVAAWYLWRASELPEDP
ncbi:MAG: DNA-3-methyladenine glycosylase 2 family protein [Polyangiaceae bacterium]|jgi:methylated-DNA-[protein]-cysteine S-methyltransferase|nr:DNA-3-methyladenine glycosylase 2 family protein [Polyangiaceae bacterium]